MKKINCILVFILLMFGTQISAQQLVHTPVNPNFGGNYLNYSWLLASANAQNPFDDQDLTSDFKNSALSGFSDSMKRQILNQLTRGMFSDNESGIGSEPGSYEVGGLYITIEEIRGGSIISIIDSETGEYTEIIL